MNAAAPTSAHRIRTVVIAAVVVVAVVVAGVTLALTVHLGNGNGAGPSAFALDGITRAPPGAAGCQTVPAEVCYAVELASSFHGLPAANLFFAVSLPSQGGQFPANNSARLGVAAVVSEVNGSTVRGVWNLTTQTWSTYPSGTLPWSVDTTLVLDTGLTSNATFAGDWFYIQHSSPYGGSVSFRLD